MKDLAFLDDAQAKELDNVVVESGDVLINITGASIARCCIVPSDILPARVNQHVTILRPRTETLLPRLLHYLLISPDYKDQLLNAGDGAGATRQALTKAQLQEFWIRYPEALAEQHRIVGILDKAFAGIATAKANAEKNLRNARDFVAASLETAFSRASSAWPLQRLGDVMAIGSSKRVMEREWTTEGVPFYGGREVVKLARGESVESDAFISQEKYSEIARKYGVPAAGDILMTARGTIGVGYIVRPSDTFYYKDGNLMSLHPTAPLNSQFILYAFRTNAVLEQLGGLSGTTVTHLPIERANTLMVRIPTKSEQDDFVARLNCIERKAKRIATLYQEKLAALEELKKSLLHQAFGGGTRAKPVAPKTLVGVLNAS